MEVRDHICQKRTLWNLLQVLSAALYQLSPQTSEQEPEERTARGDCPSGGQAGSKGMDKWGHASLRREKQILRPVAKWVPETLKSGSA